MVGVKSAKELTTVAVTVAIARAGYLVARVLANAVIPASAEIPKLQEAGTPHIRTIRMCANKTISLCRNARLNSVQRGTASHTTL
jgi:hypothetical protein